MNKNVLHMISLDMQEQKALVDKVDLVALEASAVPEDLKTLVIFLKVCSAEDLVALAEVPVVVIQMLHNAEMIYNKPLLFHLKRQPLEQRKKFQLIVKKSVRNVVEVVRVRKMMWKHVHVVVEAVA